MAQFPIVYSETLPPGEGSAVRANLDVSTGAEAIGAGMMALGGAFEKIADAKDAIELSTLRRTFDEKSYVAFNEYSKTGDEEARKVIVQKWSQDIERIQSKSARVNREFLIHKNSTLPHWGDAFAKQELAIQARQADDAAEVSIQKAMEYNDQLGAAKEIMKLAHLGRISQAKAEQRIVDLPNDTKLQMARVAAGKGDLTGAENLLADADEKTMSAEKLEYRNRFLAVVQRQQAEILTQKQDETSRTLLADLWDNRLTDPNVVTAALRQGWLSDTDAKYLRDAMLNPKPAETRLPSYVKVKEALQDLVLGTKTKQDVLSLITSMTDSLSPADVKSFTNDVYAEPDKENTFWEREAYQTIEKRLMTIDPLSGRLFGSTAQIDATDRAKVRFDEAIKSAAKVGKPLKGTDYLKKAVEISNVLAPKEKQITFGGQKLPASEFEEFVIKKPENPFPEYPDAFYEAGEWRVIRDRKKYRIKP